mmetsp:Transcript_8304/g.25121  ORF Transcript_8304/g.25121 Transcript_8304/m.25121 type:complete len:93 (+) Transcript_8304:1161-1439(+)|eukprot:365023-Chlamydomonas_euryale.AAC.25
MHDVEHARGRGTWTCSIYEGWHIICQAASAGHDSITPARPLRLAACYDKKLSWGLHGTGTTHEGLRGTGIKHAGSRGTQQPRGLCMALPAIV